MWLILTVKILGELKVSKMIRKLLYSGMLVSLSVAEAGAAEDICRDMYYLAGEAMVFRADGTEIREALRKADEHDNAELLKEYIFQAYTYPVPHSVEVAMLQVVEFAEFNELHCLQYPETYQ